VEKKACKTAIATVARMICREEEERAPRKKKECPGTIELTLRTKRHMEEEATQEESTSLDCSKGGGREEGEGEEGVGRSGPRSHNCTKEKGYQEEGRKTQLDDLLSLR